MFLSGINEFEDEKSSLWNVDLAPPSFMSKLVVCIPWLHCFLEQLRDLESEIVHEEVRWWQQKNHVPFAPEVAPATTEHPVLIDDSFKTGVTADWHAVENAIASSSRSHR